MKRIFFFLLLLSSFSLAQNAGNTGTQTVSKQVWSSISSAQRSTVVQNIGQAAHYITYCSSSNAAFSFDVEESPDGTTWIPFSPVVTQLNSKSNCGLIVACGYFNNITLNGGPTAGTLSAWYSASTGPGTCYSPGSATSGQSALPLCDQVSFVTLAGNASATAILPAPATANIYYCGGWTISLTGAVSTGLNGISVQFGNSTCSSTSGVVWELILTPSSPLDIAVPAPVDKLPLANAAGSTLCASLNGPGTTGVTAYVSYKYATF